jgi:choline dehydrogenase-like flavoprotein
LSGTDVESILYKFCVRDVFTREYPEQVTRAENITTYLHATTLEIETNSAGDVVQCLRAATLEGKRFSVRARLFVLATGGIETPRLMLLSNRAQSAGVGNQNDLVGRFFMEHPHFWSGVFVPSNPGLLESLAFYTEIHSVRGVPILGKLALSEAALRREQLLNQNIELLPWMPSRAGDPMSFWGHPHPLPRGEAAFNALWSGLRQRKKIENMGTHLRNVAADLPAVMAGAGRRVRNRFKGVRRPPMLVFANMMEQVPNPESRVKLGADRDLFGQPRVQLDWRITAQDIRSARRTQEIIGGALERAGLGAFSQKLRDDTPPTNTEGGYHHMGTTRMHLDPKQGVVNPDCRVHGTGNLFIAGPSVFPTVGYANPVLTLVALTLRLADHLKKQMQ